MLDVLDSQEAVCVGCVGWIFFSPKEKWQFSVQETLPLELSSAQSHAQSRHPGGAEDGGVSAGGGVRAL